MDPEEMLVLADRKMVWLKQRGEELLRENRAQYQKHCASYATEIERESGIPRGMTLLGLSHGTIELSQKYKDLLAPSSDAYDKCGKYWKRVKTARRLASITLNEVNPQMIKGQTMREAGQKASFRLLRELINEINHSDFSGGVKL